jgi:hypothetical protein
MFNINTTLSIIVYKNYHVYLVLWKNLMTFVIRAQLTLYYIKNSLLPSQLIGYNKTDKC